MDNDSSLDITVSVELDAPAGVSPEEVALVESQLADLMKQALMQPDPDEE